MKVRVPADNLTPEVAWVQSAVPKNPSHAVLNGCRIVADEETGLSIETTGDEFSMWVHIDVAMVDEPGEVVVPARLFHTIVDMLWDILTLETVGNTFRISGGKGASYVLPQITEPFPSGRFEADPMGMIDAAELKRALRRIEHALLGPHGEPALYRGFHFLAEGTGELTLGATNRYSVAQTIVKYPGADIDITPDGRHVLDIVRGMTGNIMLSYSDHHLMLSDSLHRAILRVYEDKFPRFDRAIEAAAGTTFSSSYDRQELLDALARLGKVHEKNMPVTLAPAKDGSCTITTFGSESVVGGSEVIDCFSTHDGFAIDFNPKMLADSLYAHDGAEVIKITNGSGQATKPMWIGHDKADVITVVNPIRLPKKEN